MGHAWVTEDVWIQRVTHLNHNIGRLLKSFRNLINEKSVDPNKTAPIGLRPRCLLLYFN